MLSAQSTAIVRATVPVVRSHGVAITSEFYRSLFTDAPDLLAVFNRGNQATGEQQRALASSVVAFAEHLLGTSAAPFAPVLDRIAHKHASLGVHPEQYTVVGRHLLGAVATVLGAAVTAEVAAAWDEVYWLFACRLIAAETRLYQRAGVDPAGAFRPWRVAQRVAEADDVVSFTLVPDDGGAVPDFRPGQYVSLAVNLPDGSRQPRQYTLSHGPGQDYLRITVRRVRGVDGSPDGVVSTYLHTAVRPGDVLDVGEPFGDVTLDRSSAPLVLVSAGVGITLSAAMVDHVARSQPDREVLAVHADQTPQSHALREELRTSGAQLRSFRQLTWYERPEAADGANSRSGRVDVEEFPLPIGAHAYLCGPLPFMRDVRAGLLRRGMTPEQIRYEVFGVDLWAGQPTIP